MTQNKNIWILPTDKLSRLHKAFDKVFILSNELTGVNDLYKSVPQKTYITSNEKPKAGDWSIYQNNIIKCIEDIIGDEFKKIILTDDTDLINDGIQEIPEEFFQWFVDNSNCNKVDITHFNNNCKGECGICDNSCGNLYKIIIPQKKTKQETREYDLLQDIKFCVSTKNESLAIKIIERYGLDMQYKIAKRLLI